jgi:hypothetical protein
MGKAKLFRPAHVEGKRGREAAELPVGPYGEAARAIRSEQLLRMNLPAQAVALRDNRASARALARRGIGLLSTMAAERLAEIAVEAAPLISSMFGIPIDRMSIFFDVYDTYNTGEDRQMPIMEVGFADAGGVNPLVGEDTDRTQDAVIIAFRILPPHRASIRGPAVHIEYISILAHRPLTNRQSELSPTYTRPLAERPSVLAHLQDFFASYVH